MPYGMDGKKIEACLVPATRTIVDADGVAIELEQTALFWDNFDFLTLNGFFTESELIEFGHATVAEFGLPFPMAIQDAVKHLYRSWLDPNHGD